MRDFEFWKMAVGVICTLGLYSVLYRETKVYRFFEHMFLGLAAGFSLVALWTETLKSVWWDKMVGQVDADGKVTSMGYPLYILLLPIGLMAYFVFSKKSNWMSRIPIGIILGLWAGQQADNWIKTFWPQIYGSMKPIVPNTFDPIFVPGGAANIPNAVYVTQAVNNVIFLVTLLSVMSYFFFSFEIKSRFLKGTTTLGRWLLMIGFGAIFGSTVMTRFTLLIDRMYFVFIEFLKTNFFS